MSADTKIEWCDSTFNPWIGCTKVSPGCAHCYAERDFDMRKHVAKWGAGQPRHRTSEAYWMQPLKWDRAAAEDHNDWELHLMLHSGCPHYAEPRRPRVFCGSLCDWLDDEVPVEWLADLLNLWRGCSNLDILALTKRPHLWRSRMEAVAEVGSDVAESWLDGNPPRNVWIGTTVEDQARADERIPALLSIPARVRFLSCEPLLGPVDLSFGNPKWRTAESYHAEIHWVICGGESGPKARPMHPAWARSLRDQCAAAGVAFLFKQWGEWKPIGQMADGESDLYADFARDGKPAPRDEADKRPAQKNAESTVLQLDGSQRWDFPSGAMTCFRTGKHAAGRLLDGHEHNAFPEVARG